MPGTAPGLFTIGHSNQALDHFLGLLRQHGIEAVADVRTVPRSRFVPHFSAGPLREALTHDGVGYLSSGRELGGRPEGDEFYDDQGYVLYGRLATSPAFEQGLERLVAAARASRVAVLCSEEDPSRCHRHLLIGRVLRERGMELAHIRRDGRIETEGELAAREAGAGSQTGNDAQATLFNDGPGQPPWRSPRPVTRRRPSPGPGGR